MMCRIGKGVKYYDGVSPVGKKYYDHFISLLGDQYAPHVMALLTDYDIQNKLLNGICRVQTNMMFGVLLQNVINDRYKESIAYIQAKIEKTGKIVFETKFKKLTASFINWEGQFGTSIKK